MLSTYCSSCGVKVGETDDFKWLQENVKTIQCDRCANRPPATVASVIRDTPQLPQVQYSIQQQLAELRTMSNKLGLYDASDLIRQILEK